MEFNIGDINSAIEALARAQQKTHDQVSKVLVMAVYASIKGIEVGKTTEYASVANALLKVLRTSMKRDAIVAFLEHYGKLAFIKGGRGEFKHFDVAGTEQAKLEWTPDYVEQVKLAASNWESFRKAPTIGELDIEAKVQDLISAVAKAQKSNRPVKGADLVPELTAALAKFHAKHANDTVGA